jgi:hypothetical protein
LIRCCFVIIIMVDTIYFTSSRSSLKYSPTFGTIHYVFLQHLDFYSYHATLFPTQVWGGDTWEFHLSLLLCIIYIYICACIFFWLISFYLWLVLVFLFNKVYYGFTPLRHRTSQQDKTNQRLIEFIQQETNANGLTKPWRNLWMLLKMDMFIEEVK